MPTRERVASFIEAVVHGSHVDAIANFYHEDATMQENLHEPRRGREALMAHEAAALARLQRMFTHPPRVVAIDGDNVAINWIFDATDKAGTTRRLQEVALQRWRGDRIIEERFFYDTKTAWTEVVAE